MYQAPYQQFQPDYQYGYRYNFPQPNQPMQQTPQMQRQIAARVISNQSEIMPNEVPMDGSMALFMMADGSEVIGKRWTADGKIADTHFIPQQNQQSEAPSFEQTVLSRLESIEGMLSTPKRATRKPKEVNDAEC